ncbi:hypothetical protein T265_09558 [Opisthorchis viverrini]|uniref:Uncharacterized protein n=1 Tax=Opisthorchis viverrini TaxID=6198 RepID=A0A074Z5F8_OPIVI|nr:hypothetical protein T265_09558 [Opisthorchis viverrini]KER22313.1 hypothetical protein T265_09558 [Opisthorchis viverrini]
MSVKGIILLRCLLELFQYRGETTRWLGRELTDWKVPGSDPISTSPFLLSRLGKHGSVPALVIPSGRIAVGHRKGATAEAALSVPLRELTDQKVDYSNRTSLSRLFLYGQPGSFPVLMILSGGIAARHRKSVEVK